MAAFRFPAGMQVELFAADPQVGNPVAIGLDEQGRVFVAEEYRFNRGTEENRSRPFLLEDDLQLQTTDDRLAMFRKFADTFDGGMSWFSKYSDQIRVLDDRAGDGAAGRTVVACGNGGVKMTGLPLRWRRAIAVWRCSDGLRWCGGHHMRGIVNGGLR